MNPTAHRPVPGFTSLRSGATCFFISILLLYSIYSSTFIISSTKHDDDTLNCPLQPLSAKQNFQQSDNNNPSPPQNTTPSPLEIKHVAFGIAASSNLWNKRKEYIKLWWRPEETCGVVWLDNKVTISEDESKKLPEIRISEDTSNFNYSNKQGRRYALRISRVVSETLRIGMKKVRWFVMGDALQIRPQPVLLHRELVGEPRAEHILLVRDGLWRRGLRWIVGVYSRHNESHPYS